MSLLLVRKNITLDVDAVAVLLAVVAFLVSGIVDVTAVVILDGVRGKGGELCLRRSLRLRLLVRRCR